MARITGTIGSVFLLLGAGLAFALLVPLVLRQRRAGNLVWLGAAAAGSLVLGATVQGFGEQPAPCERAEQVYSLRADPTVMDDLAETYEMTVTWLRSESAGAQESLQIMAEDGTVASVDAGAPLTDAALRCAGRGGEAAGE